MRVLYVESDFMFNRDKIRQCSDRDFSKSSNIQGACTLLFLHNRINQYIQSGIDAYINTYVCSLCVYEYAYTNVYKGISTAHVFV